MTHAFFKGAALPRRRQRDSRHVRRAGHAQDGRAREEDSDHVPHDADRDAGDRRNSAARRIFQQGRNSRRRRSSTARLLWVVGWITAGMTAFYMFRLMFMTFYGESRVDHDVEHHIHESPSSMTVPLMMLAVLSIIGGWIGAIWRSDLRKVPRAGDEPSSGSGPEAGRGSERKRRALLLMAGVGAAGARRNLARVDAVPQADRTCRRRSGASAGALYDLRRAQVLRG